jgi:class 3 adenylate cyclase
VIWLRQKLAQLSAAPRSETVTFVFTDMEGSTDLERELGELYQPTRERHRQIMSVAVGTHGGSFEPVEGDGGYIVFHSARSALAACVAAQKALSTEPWPDGATVAVRMGLNTGEAMKLRNGRYAGLSVNLASRVKDAAHGGQIAVSEATKAAVGEALPPDTRLKDLGRYRLKGFPDPVSLFQVCHSSIRVDFPPIQKADPVDVPPGSEAPLASRNETKPARNTSSDRHIEHYRSPGTPRGAFRQPGDIHVHIDGGSNALAIYDTLSDYEGKAGKGQPRFPMKFDAIKRFAAGPQRDDRAFVQTYRFHTPGVGEQESFNTFSTMRLGSGSDLEPEAIDVLRAILTELPDWPGAVVELERVMGILEPGGVWEDADPPRIADPDAFDSDPLRGFPRLATSPIEIHHAIDFPKRRGTRNGAPILGVDELPTWPNLGGWFLFEKDNVWSFRSSEFLDRSGEFRYASHDSQKRLLDALSGIGCDYKLHTLAEQVLGIWRGGSAGSEEKRTVPALGDWEKSCPPGGHIWVIAANFLGDRNPDVRRAMVRNLSQNVTYTYFLRSDADVLRLSRLASQLERDLITRENKTADRARRVVSERVQCLLLDSGHSGDQRLKSMLADDYFLCPSHDSMGGFRLDRSGFSGERIEGDEYEYLVQTLSPLLNASISDLFSSTWESHTQHRVVACTEFEGTAVDQDQDSWRAMLRSYDYIVAGQVSMHGSSCDVVRPVRNGYLLVFEDPREAGDWAKRLQFQVQWHNQDIAKRGAREIPIPTHNIALGYGSVTRILRAHGNDYVGGSIDECIHLAQTLRGGQIVMSRMFADQYEASVGRQEFVASTRLETDYLVGELRLLE